MISIPVAFRAWVKKEEKKSKGRPKKFKKPQFGFRSMILGERVLVLDMETTVDSPQNLLFGSFRVYASNELVHEGIIADDDLKEAERKILDRYASEHNLTLYPHKSFIKDIFYPEAYKLGTLIVGFNLPFDLSRLAIKSAAGRKNRRDGFTLTLSPDYYSPRIHIKAIDSKGAFIKFDFPKGITRGQYFEGHFLDLRRLVRALTDKGHSLESACHAYHVEHSKQKTKEHGKITPEYIDYNRRDVLATWELFLKLWDDYGCHPISRKPSDDEPPALQITKAHSPATIGKAYLKQMGIRPFLDEKSNSFLEILGHAMASYYGGRAEVHIRKQIVPVTYVDVTSMYPSVFVLQNLWPWMTAEKITPVQSPEFTAEIQKFIDEVKLEDFFDQKEWKKLPVLVQIHPNDDILPIRGKYEQNADEDQENEVGVWQIGINYFTHHEGLWYSLAECVASKFLTGKSMRILDAIGFEPMGIQATLKPVKLRDNVFVDPATGDFFKTIIEERHRIKKLAKTQDKNVDTGQLETLEHFLKIMANSTAYGISAQLNPEKGTPLKLQVFGQGHFPCDTSSYEKPGPYASPLIAAFVTSGARLLMAMMEAFLVKEGTTYAFCDTDSMAIVGEGPEVAEKLIKRFESLNPYATGEPLIKMEKENFNEANPEQFQQLYFYGISAKRYVLFNKIDEKAFLRKFSQHGLGHLLSPLPDKEQYDPYLDEDYEEDNVKAVDREKGRKWIRRIWEYLLSLELGLRVRPPAWFKNPAIAQLTISQPTLWEPLRQNDKPYSEQIKPFNFMLVGFSSKLIAKGEKPPRPIAPYEKDRKKWPTLHWIDARTGKTIIADLEPEPSHLAGHVHFKTYSDIVEDFLFHPEIKAAGTDGEPCRPNTRGVLGRLHVQASKIRHIGKETNNLEKVQAMGGAEEEQLEYQPAWEELKKELQGCSSKLLAKFSGLSRKAIYKLLRTTSIPRPKTFTALNKALKTIKEPVGR